MPFDHFEFLAPYYERAMSPRYPAKLVELAGLPISGALLDAGGGTGRVAQSLKGMAAQIVVADLSTGMLKQAAGKDGLRRVCSFTERLPFPDGSFERIIMVDALHHVCDQEQTARELWRVLAPAGRILIQEPDVRLFAVKLIALVEKLALMRSHFLPPARIEGLFPFPNAGKRVVGERYNAWVIVGKP